MQPSPHGEEPQQQQTTVQQAQRLLAPTISTPAANQTVQCDGNGNVAQLLAWLNNRGGAVATDLCGSVSWSNNYTGITPACGNTGSTTVIFTVSDACGNTTTSQAMFIIQDTTNPTITAPANITLSCGFASNNAIVQAWLQSYVASDACSNVTVTNNFTSIPATCVAGSNTATVTWTATDACGKDGDRYSYDHGGGQYQTSDHDQSTSTSGRMYRCQQSCCNSRMAAASFGGAAAVDNCDLNLTQTFTAGTPVAGCGMTSTTVYTYTATDDCGNFVQRFATLFIIDNTAPVLTLPTATNTVACDGAITTVRNAWFASASGLDGCGGTVTISQSLVSQDESCVGTVNTITETYLFTATDACGNQSTNTAVFTIRDAVAPTIIAPANLTIACGGNNATAILAWLQAYTVTEACSDYIVTNNYNGSIPNLCNGGPTTVMWTVTDECGATGSATSQIVVTPDTQGPTFVNCPADITVNVDIDLCASNVIYSTPVATDCNGVASVTRTSGIVSGGVFPLGATSIVFTATDNCGNTSTCNFTITVVDSDKPSISCPSNTVVVCTDNNVCTWVSDASVNPLGVDNCPGATISYVITGMTPGSGTNSAMGTVFNLGTSIVTYTITAANGQTATCSFNVVVEDCQVPVITCPANLTVECASATLNAAITTWRGTATATDNCTASPTITSVLVSTNSQCGNTETRLYRFTATDAAGNSSVCEAMVFIVDTTPPTISTPAANQTVQCDGNGNVAQLLAWLNNRGGAVATDLCGSVSWSNNYTGITPACGNTGSTTVIFTVSDACGNTTTSQAMFIIQDTTNPTITAPANITLSCGFAGNDAIVQAWLQSYVTSDACSTVTVTNNFTSIPATCVAGSNTATVTWTATDACGRTATGIATITVVDNIKPTIMRNPIDLTVECNAPTTPALIAAWVASFGGATAVDNCDLSVTLTLIPGIAVPRCGGTSSTLYTLTATDDCGNFIQRFATLHIIDTSPPQITTNAANLTVDCDGSGNLTALNNWLNTNGGAIANDGCSAISWTYVLVNKIDLCGGNTGTSTYRFTVRDDCGNTSSSTANFIIRDITPPTISTPAQVFSAQCDGSNNASQILDWLNNNGRAGASDLCSNVRWTNNYGTIVSDCGTTGGVLVTFTATDNCNNSSQTSAMFSITDSRPPVWEILPQNLVIECDGSLDPYNQIISWLNTVGGAEAKDSCSLVVYSNNYTGLTDGCSSNTGSALVSFRATDACGNSVTAQATISVVDNVGPTITTMARDTIVECDGTGNTANLATWLANNGGARANDLCSAPLIWSNQLINTTTQCGGTRTSRYRFWTTDACGNISVNTEASFRIVDTTIPVFDTPPQNLTVECDGNGNIPQRNAWLAANANLIASDLCGQVASINYDLVSDVDLCGMTGRSLYRFTIVDACGNSATREASFIIVDTAAPVISGGADKNMEECTAPPAGNYPEFDFWLTNRAGATATDECGTFEWSNNYKPANWVVQCGNTRYVDVRFYATDVCGNIDSITHRFSIGDVTPPVFTNCPRPPVIVDAPAGWCSSYVNFSAVAATDNCSAVTINKIDATGLSSGSLFPVGLTILIYEAVDLCGNKDTCEVKIIVNDFHTPPTIVCPRDTIVFNDLGKCGAKVNNIAPVSVGDNCKDNLAVTFQVLDSTNTVVNNGIEDASGEEFPVGKNTVTYKVFDQPILLITEIFQNGTISGVEIGNFGPAKYNISCLVIRRESSGVIQDFIVPNGTIVGVGGVYIHNFSVIPQGQTATYSIRFLSRVIDAITVNSGILIGSNFYRNSPIDTDNQKDFVIADVCHPGSYGVWNPSLPIFTDNGKTTSLQSEAPSMASCSFKVTVKDIEAPKCGMFDSLSFVRTNIGLAANTCIKSNITVGAGIVGAVSIEDLRIIIGNAGALHAYLTSPMGTQIKLFGNLCEGTSNVNVNLTDQVATSIVSAPCNPLGAAGIYKPLNPFKAFFGEQAAGVWSLDVYLDSNTTGTITNWDLNILTVSPYIQADVTINNDPGKCAANYTWNHPVFNDNCCEGSMTVTYNFVNTVTGVTSTETKVILSASGVIDLDGASVTRLFDVGMTTIIYTLIDKYGNESECGFKVTVLDKEPPTFPFGCQDVTITLAPGECFYDLKDDPKFVDNCAANIIQYCDVNGKPYDITKIPVGNNIIIIKVTDIYGNAASCEIKVSVFKHKSTSNTLVCNGNINVSWTPTRSSHQR
ncbi:MAG: HYR domain-containing protein [Saprospiraceae bacterium]|nr:HYR domain-containing protein [Saprospiraceae bacterium]